MAEIRALKHLIEPSVSVKVFNKDRSTYSHGNKFDRVQSKVLQVNLLSRAVCALTHFRYSEKFSDQNLGFFFGIGQEIDTDNAVIGSIYPQDIPRLSGFMNLFDINVICWTSLDENDSEFQSRKLNVDKGTAGSFYVFASVYTKNFFGQTIRLKIDRGNEEINSLSIIPETPIDIHIGPVDWSSVFMRQQLAQTILVSFLCAKDVSFSCGVFEKMTGEFEVRLCLTQNISIKPDRKRSVKNFRTEDEALSEFERVNSLIRTKLMELRNPIQLNYTERFGYDKDSDDISVELLNAINLGSKKEF